MLDLLWLIPALPCAGFVVLVMVGSRLSRPIAASLGVISVGLSAAVALLVGVDFIWFWPENIYAQRLWTWIAVDRFTPAIGFSLDALSLVMILVVSVVGFLILLYSAGFMIRSEGYSRFFAYMNLFVGSMLTLVMADNLLLLYLGWEGVGLCSYLLIGFWYSDPANGRAAIKAFIVTRVGDASMAVGIFLIFVSLGTLQIQDAVQRAQITWAVGSGTAIAASALLLGGALGKSAQLPLQTWLPDAMAGPTPVSALIHAATMVTAGVYLIARTHVLFTLAPPVLTAIAVIGAITLLIAGVSALTQHDIKRVLAYSTISQVGYMFLALGVGAWSAAVFHFVTHACFKALLFLCAGVVIQGLDEEHNMFKMGGLRRLIPGTFWCFLVGAASLSALPIVTAGFYSKDLILMEAWSSQAGGGWLWLAGLAGAFLTSMYAFRMVFLTFFGEAKATFHKRADITMKIPLVILSALSIVTGLIETPRSLGNITFFSDFMESVLPELPARALNAAVEISVPLASVIGLYLAYLLFLRRRGWTERISGTPAGSLLHAYWFSGWGFDWLYDRLIVMPFVRAANWNKEDVIDLGYGAIAWVSTVSSMALALTQTGKIRWYAAAIALGALLFMGIVVLG
ncbi:MAG TPA: NADH-quinone oxidoreductase subunit L [Syntrophorhabdales bacterium]|nr:NADH-quinone oxidoreductase subunit L [Syntrophorhabdales bacterium]